MRACVRGARAYACAYETARGLGGVYFCVRLHVRALVDACGCGRAFLHA